MSFMESALFTIPVKSQNKEHLESCMYQNPATNQRLGFLYSTNTQPASNISSNIPQMLDSPFTTTTETNKELT